MESERATRKHDHLLLIIPWKQTLFEDFVVDGDKVAVRLNVVGRHKREYKGIPATDVEIKIAAIHVISLVGDKIKDWWAVEDHLGWYRQLGLELKPK